MASRSNEGKTDLSSSAHNVESTSSERNTPKRTSLQNVGAFEEEQFVASDSFCKRMESMISKEDVRILLEKQKEAVRKFEKTNETFARFNDLSASRYAVLGHNFAHHTKMLLDMKKDLDSVFRRIRILKTKLTKQYGHAFYATSASIQKLEEELGASIESEDTASVSTLTTSKELDTRNDSSTTETTLETVEQETSQRETEIGEDQGETNREDAASAACKSTQSDNCLTNESNTLDNIAGSKLADNNVDNEKSKAEKTTGTGSVDNCDDNCVKDEDNAEDKITIEDVDCCQDEGSTGEIATSVKHEENYDHDSCKKEEENTEGSTRKAIQFAESNVDCSQDREKLNDNKAGMKLEDNYTDCYKEESSREKKASNIVDSHVDLNEDEGNSWENTASLKSDVNFTDSLKEENTDENRPTKDADNGVGCCQDEKNTSTKPGDSNCVE